MIFINTNISIIFIHYPSEINIPANFFFITIVFTFAYMEDVTGFFNKSFIDIKIIIIIIIHLARYLLIRLHSQAQLI